jgi:hypothetical protein
MLASRPSELPPLRALRAARAERLSAPSFGAAVAPVAWPVNVSLLGRSSPRLAEKILERPVMHYGEPNLNESKDWSEMDLFDLKNSIARNTPAAEIADFLCRSEKEVREIPQSLADAG